MRRTRARWVLAAAAALAATALGDAARQVGSASIRGDSETQPETRTGGKRLRWSQAARDRALQQASVWGVGPQGQAVPWSATLECRFEPEAAGGTTPKFECITGSGESVKVKYSGAEPHAEVAASRLLRSIGFPADDVRIVERVRCYGCPAFPFLTMRVLGLVNAHAMYARSLDYAEHRDIEGAAVERRHPALEIAAGEGRGWTWQELERVAAPRAHVDALRLMAMLLAHWDNKAENQRLVCLDADAGSSPVERCERPLALVQDLGATFGPRKVNLRRWRRAPIWKDRAACLVSMATMPHGGGTFPEVRISEEGRRFLAERLASVSRRDATAIFEDARFAEHGGESVAEWVGVLEEKVREISVGPPCPSR